MKLTNLIAAGITGLCLSSPAIASTGTFVPRIHNPKSDACHEVSAAKFVSNVIWAGGTLKEAMYMASQEGINNGTKGCQMSIIGGMLTSPYPSQRQSIKPLAPFTFED